LGRWSLYFTFAGLVLAAASAHAERQATAAIPSTPIGQTQLKDLSLEELGNIQVTSFSKTSTELWDTPAAVFIISGQDILRSGATSIAEALRLAPGVEVGRVSSTTWAVGIRGLQSNFSK
jgi:iron complex outermembrane receptor protein